jgi:polar amino acid transport system substrate-binding protein
MKVAGGGVKMKNRAAILVPPLVLSLLVCGCSTSDVELGKTDNLPELLIGIDDSYEPYTYVDENGEYIGLDVELAKEACKRMDMEPVFVAIKWDNKNVYLADGAIDCIWSCFSINGRESDYTWVGPYMNSRQMVAVASDSDIENISDLNGRSVAVMSTTKPETIFLERESDDIPEVGELYSMEDMEYVFTALQYGYVDAAAGHEIMMREYMDSMAGDYRLLDEELQAVNVGVAFDKNNPSEAAAQLDKALADMKDDGTLGEILEKYGISADATGGGGSS